MLAEDEYRELAVEIRSLDLLIEELSEYMKSTGRAYADHAATLRRWARKENTHSVPDYSCKEGESL